MHEHIVAAAIRLDEAKTFLRVEPLDGALRHGGSPYSYEVEKNERCEAGDARYPYSSCA